MGRWTPIEAKALTLVETFREGEDIGEAIDRLALALDEKAARPGDHLDFVHVVEVKGEEPEVFDSRSLAERFKAAAEDGRVASALERPVYTGASAERLIASERADVLEGMGWESVADDMREGLSPLVVAHRVASVSGGSEGEDKLMRVLQHWAEEDAKGGEPEAPVITFDGVGFYENGVRCPEKIVPETYGDTDVFSPTTGKEISNKQQNVALKAFSDMERAEEDAKGGDR